jgi:acetoin:2,6-dichlorophenolindophenol oxidoreductase subunit alpha
MVVHQREVSIQGLEVEALLRAYRQMRTIREFEEALIGLVSQGKLPGFLHLYAGEEAVAVGVCSHLDDGDFVNSTHRGHGHCIAKGVDVRGMIAELFGRATGTCKGKGGSMHIADLDRGMVGANGIVGAGIPLTTGAALTLQYKRTRGVSVGFFGDGATNQGSFHESLNLAKVWNLPAVYVIENNLYGEASPMEFVTAVTDLAKRGAGYDLPTAVVDGMDFFAVHEAAGKAIERARQGGGPTLLECKTYRFYGHYVGDPMTYRSKEETETWRRRDPLLRFASRVTEAGVLGEDDLSRVDTEAREEIAAAVAAAEQDPYPDLSAVSTDVYVRP